MKIIAEDCCPNIDLYINIRAQVIKRNNQRFDNFQYMDGCPNSGWQRSRE